MTDKIVESAAVLAQAKREGLTLRKLGKRTTIPYSTLKGFASGTYRGNKTATAQRVISQVVPLLKRWPPKPPVTKPPQLKQLNPTVHAALRKYIRSWGSEMVGRWYQTNPRDLDACVRGTCQQADTIQRLLDNVNRLGFPDAPACKHCGGAL